MIPLSTTAATLVVAAVRSWWCEGEADARHLWMSVEDYLAEQLDELARPGGDVVPVLPPTERAALVARLRAAPPAECWALVQAARRWWDEEMPAARHLADMEIPAPDLAAQFRAAGFVLTDV